jgi:NitT/TauT family transport system substrate-binding protein
MSKLLKIIVFLLISGAVGGAAAPALALDNVRFGTNWLAEGEHGGFYQALADGTYQKYGLNVTIVQGGPQSPNRALLLGGQVDLFMAGNMLGPMDAQAQDIPVVEVAAIFQKDPQVFLVHPDGGINTFADMAKLPTIFLGDEGLGTFFQWMKWKFPGFKDAQYKPYQFDPAPFVADKNSAMQGYATSEPYAVQQAAGWRPKVFLLADNGWSTPSTMIEGKRDYVTTHADIVQRFIDASVVGWYNYLYGDNTAANALIKKENPDMTDGQLAFTLSKMKEDGLVDSGITAQKGIGCFDDAQIQSFYDSMVQAGVLKAGLDVKSIYTNQFVCKGVGLNLKK